MKQHPFNEIVIPEDRKKIYAQLKEKYNPEGSKIRNYQHHLVSTLVEFDKFCSEHNIQYSLAYGTMLGAIRHKGFVPWDDDADIVMMRKDFDKLISLAYGEWNALNDNILLTDGVKPTIWMAPFADVDIFVLDNRPNAKVAAWIKQVLIKILYCILKCRGGIDSHKVFGNKKWIIFFPVAFILPTKIWKSLFELLSRWGNKESETCKLQAYNNVLSYIKFLYKRSDVQDYIMVDFEGHKLPVFKGYDNILRSIYGDYLSLPSKIKNHGIVDKL